MDRLSPSDRLHLTGKLRAILDGAGQLLEDLGNDTEPMALVFTADEMHNRAAETLAAIVGLCRQPGEMPFVGANVAIGVEVDDKGAQRAMAEQWAYDNERLEKARREAGIAPLLDDTAPAHSSDRDNRRSA